jgi:ribosome-associated protein
MTLSDREKILAALRGADGKKADDPIVLDLRGLSSVTDWYLVAGGTSDTQVRAIADGIAAALAQFDLEPLGAEGYNGGTWVLLDYGDLIVHVFHREKRLYYALENLWGDAPRLRLSELEGEGISSGT